jgi:hypothetical protein
MTTMRVPQQSLIMNTVTLRSALAALLLLACSSGSPGPSSSGGSGGEDPPDETGGRGGAATGGSGGQKPTGGSGGQTATGGSGGQTAGGSGGGGAGGASGGNGGEGGSPGDASTPPAADAGAPPSGDAGQSGMPVTFPGTHAACPACKSIFDGKTTTGWTSWGKTATGIGVVEGNWDVVEAALHSVGTARNVLASNGDYLNFRLIFSIKHSGGGHQPCIVIWGRRPPPNDAMGGIQIQAPHTNMWDYRPGQNKNISGTKVGSVAINDAQWAQCEVLAKGSAGSFRMACCQQDATGDKPCKGVEILRFNVAGTGNNGPVSLQAHNSGVHDMYKHIFIEDNPAVDDLLTTK